MLWLDHERKEKKNNNNTTSLKQPENPPWIWARGPTLLKNPLVVAMEVCPNWNFPWQLSVCGLLITSCDASVPDRMLMLPWKLQLRDTNSWQSGRVYKSKHTKQNFNASASNHSHSSIHHAQPHIHASQVSTSFNLSIERQSLTPWYIWMQSNQLDIASNRVSQTWHCLPSDPSPSSCVGSALPRKFWAHS